jgi:predicted metal-dependent peptidase
MDYSDEGKALSKAKIRLMSSRNCVFYSTVCLSLKHEWDENIPTACTNGLRVKYNPKFFMGLTEEVRVSVVLHETQHVIFNHMGRVAARDPNKYNIAADYVINLIAKDAGFKIPPDWLLNNNYRDKATGQVLSTEEVYALLPERNSGSGGKEILDKSATGTDLEPASSTAQAEEITAYIDDILIQASMQSGSQDAPGTIPGEVARYVDELLNPKIPWYRLMRNYLHAIGKNDYTFRKPNRRFTPEFILPTRYSEKMDRCALIIDSSGSVSDDEFSHMITETANFMKIMRPEQIDVVQFTTKITSCDSVKSLSELQKVDFYGKGGTDIAPVMAWIEEKKPVVSIIFTDGKFYSPTLKPKTPIIWLIHGNPSWTAPFGKVIHFEFDNN